MKENKDVLIPSNEDMVEIKTYIPDILIELRYSTKENFTGKIIYNYKKAYLRYGTVKKLQNAQKVLKEKGYGLKIWDAFRTVDAQFVLWDVYPVDDYVADPTKGFSNHSRGNAVDVTIVDLCGKEIKMPTAFDDFEAMANYDYDSEHNKEATKNAYMLKDIMVGCGFRPSTSEWWHFNDLDAYPVEKNFTHKE